MIDELDQIAAEADGLTQPASGPGPVIQEPPALDTVQALTALYSTLFALLAPAWLILTIPIGRPSTCCSSQPVAVRPRPISDWLGSPWF